MSEHESPGGGSGRFGFSRRKFLAGSAVAAAVAAVDPLSLSLAGASSTTIANENALQGASPDEWDMWENDAIEGFASPFSADAGSSVDFKVKTTESYRIDIYRMGWYGGQGARKIDSIPTTPRNQPTPYRDNHVGVVDCGNWLVSATWNIPSNAVSGVYFANFISLDDSSVTNRCQFIVRNDGRQADILFQTCDTTYQAYNGWGGSSLYNGISDYGRAVKVSYNRPLQPDAVENTFQYAELPLLRWLERNGYDVTYCAGVDVHASASHLSNRKIFLSQAHDEYWSGPQRTHVEAARDSGMNCIFMTGNEVFWRVRFESSFAGTSTPNRTMVCYKETLDGAKTDPSSEWTGTWRDPRFGGPGAPENSLTGTLFKAIDLNDSLDFAIEVPYAYSRLRLWRNTSVASIAPGTKATLSASTLGYEWNTDEINSARPPGLIRMSETTQIADQVLQDYGSTYIRSPLTHYLTQYRAPSGALVFSTGSCQWAWGLDGYHENTPSDVVVPTDKRIQQATVNLLADMGAQPGTMQNDLVAAAKSTDTLPPVTTITSPANGANLPIGSPVTISGSCVDAGGGVVAGVEVSTDGGTTWQPTTGTSSWSFSYVPLQTGSHTIRVRGIDDSSNLETTPASITINAGPRTFPCSIWPTTTAPKNTAANDPSPIEVGVKFRTSINGFVSGIRFYKGSGNTGTHTGSLWTTAGQKLASVTFANETATGWQQALFTTPVAVAAGQTYVASYFAPNGNYAGDQSYFAEEAYSLAPLTALGNTEAAGNGVFNAGSSGFPTSSYQGSNYWVDIVFDVDDHRAPTVIDHNPASNIDAVSLTSAITATFSEAMTPSSITMEVRPTGGTPIAGTVTYDDPTQTASFTPTAALAPRTAYTAKVLTGTDKFATDLAAPVTWSFTTAAPGGTYPATFWDSSATPSKLTTDDPHAVEVGLRFTAEAKVNAEAIRFYKGTTDSGVHTGHLWKADGTLLASTTFANESRVGWQQAALSTPVPLDKNNVYVVSVHSTTGNGVASNGYFSEALHRPPLHAAPGDNGMFKYSATAAFPTDSWQLTNYWVDVLVSKGSDTEVPVVIDQTPAKGLQGVTPTPTLQAVFDDAIQQSNLAFTLKAGATTVPSTVAYDPATFTATLTPNAALTAGTTYTAAVTATDLAGNTMPSPFTWTFTTATAIGQVPATIWDTSAVPTTQATDDTNPVEVGVKFRSDINGAITGLRFYKSPGNNGPHIGHLWQADGTLLGSVTFANETTTGWQQANFASPLAIQANTTYVASYFAPTGRYSANPAGLATGVDREPLHALASGVDGGNGVFSYGAGSFPSTTFNAGNYWIDVVFDAVLPVTMTGQTPAAGATGVPTNTTVTATFSQAIVSGSAAIELRDTGNAVVPGSVTYDTATRTARFTPTNPLVNGAAYTVKVSGAATAEGAVLVPVQWSFTTVGSTPTGSGQTPASGATKVPISTTVSMVSSQPLQPSTIVFELRTSTNALVTGTTAYDAATRRITFTPAAVLAEGATYTARLVSATSTVGVAMTPLSWSFSTVAVPVTVFAATATPSTAQVSSSTAIEVGMKFHSTVNGQVLGVRFYKGTANTGTHTGHLWSSSGTLLATVTFTGETATGWQTARFSNPVNITANTNYVVSYHAPRGRYAQNTSGFNSEQGTGQVRGNRHSILNSNGVYRNTSSGGFPNNGSLTSNNYWVDVLFRAS